MYQLDMRILRNNVQCSVVRPAIYDDVLQRLHIACLTRDALDAVAYRVSHVQHRRYDRSEEHTSELQSLMRISYAVFCLKQKTNPHQTTQATIILCTNQRY